MRGRLRFGYAPRELGEKIFFFFYTVPIRLGLRLLMVRVLQFAKYPNVTRVLIFSYRDACYDIEVLRYTVFWLKCFLNDGAQNRRK